MALLMVNSGDAPQDVRTGETHGDRRVFFVRPAVGIPKSIEVVNKSRERVDTRESDSMQGRKA